MKNLKTVISSIILSVLIISGVALSEFFPDIIVTSPNGAWTDTRAYSSLDAAVTAIGTNIRDLYIVRPETVTTLTIPSTATLNFVRDGAIVNSGQLTINTKNINAPDRLIFNGTGNIDFVDGSVVRSSWFRNIESAFALTTNDELTLVITEPYTITASYSPGDDVHLKWEAPGNALSINTGVVVGNLKNIEAGNFLIFTGSGDFDFLDGAVLNLSWFERLRSATTWIEDEEVTIEVTESATLDFDNTISSNTTLRVNRGSLLSGAVTLTVDGSLEAGADQIFDSTLTVAGLRNPIPEYWTNNTTPGTTDMTTAVQAAIDSVTGGKIKFGTGPYKLSNITVIGKSNLVFEGNGETVLDFSAVTTGTGFKIGYSALGGCKYIALRDLTISDTRDTSLCDILFSIEGGNTGETPSQTTAYITLDNVSQGEYNNTSGTAFYIDNVSHIIGNSFIQAYHLGCQYGLVITNTIAINTGIITFNNSTFYGSETALKIVGDGTQIDSINFLGCGIFNWTNANAAETIIIDGTSAQVDATNFIGNHIENRHAGLIQAMKVTGYVSALVMNGNHLSCGTGTDLNTYGIQFTAATMRACSFIGNEFLRLKTLGNGGYAFRFENDCSLSDKQSVEITGSFFNVTTPELLSIESGGNYDTIWNSLVLPPYYYTLRFTTVANDAAFSITPPGTDYEGFLFMRTGNDPQTSGIVVYNCDSGTADIEGLSLGTNLEVATGALAGTTGSDNKFTVSAHTDGKIYFENRMGSERTVYISFQPPLR